MSDREGARTRRRERQALGELPGGEPAELEALQRSNEEILRAHPPHEVAAEVRRRHATAEVEVALAASRRRQRLGWALVPALGVALALWAPGGAPPSTPGAPAGPPPEITLAKGLDPLLILHRAEVEGHRELKSGSQASAGDLIQLSYVAAGRRFGVIVSVDGRGGVTLHLPDVGDEAAALDPSGAHALPRSYALDDAPSFERFFLVASERPFPVEQVLSAARTLAQDPTRAQGGPLPLPSALVQSSLTLTKVNP